MIMNLENRVGVGVDMIGGDKSPLEVLEYSIPGFKRAVKNFPNYKFVLAGPEKNLKDKIPESEFHNVVYLDASYSHDNNGNIIDLEGKEVKQGDEKSPYDSRTAIVKLIKNQRNNDIAAVFGAGNTGVIVLNGGRNVGRIKGVLRSPMLTFIPTYKRGEPSILLDVGAIIETTTPYMLYQYAVMGAEVYKILFKDDNPSVKLLNVGEEGTKGTKIHQVTYNWLKSLHDEIDFKGNIEGKKGIYLGKACVIITDGLSGNMTIKGSEGAGEDLLFPMLKDELTSNIFKEIYALPLRRSFKKVLKKLSPDKYNGAIVLGLEKVLVKGHSTSNRFAFAHGIENTIKYLESDIVNKIAGKFRDEGKQNEFMEKYHYPYAPDSNKKIAKFEQMLRDSAEFSDKQVELAVNTLSDLSKLK